MEQSPIPLTDFDVSPLPTVVVRDPFGNAALEVRSHDGRHIATVSTTLTGVAIQTTAGQELAFQIETEEQPPRIHVTLRDCLNSAVWPQRTKRQREAGGRGAGTMTLLNPISFAAGVWLLSERQAGELAAITAPLDCLEADEDESERASGRGSAAATSAMSSA